MSATTFESLGLAPPLAQACAQAGYATPSPIQAAAIPPLLQGRDLLGLAPTGSGKTAAFVLPLLQRLSAGRERGFRRVQVLVLVPTRELAVQVGSEFQALGTGFEWPLKVAVLHGGVSANPQMLALRGGADVVVATPGRLLDLLGRNALRLDAVQALVLDEADRLLDLGFGEERERVLAVLPARRQTLLFSATFPAAVHALAEGLLRDPVRVESAAQVEAAPDIAQRVIEVDAGRRTELLRHLVAQGQWRGVLVFVATRHAAAHVARKLASRGIRAAALHGDMGQTQRNGALQDLRDGAIDLLVTTDLAARGIDVPGLAVIVNYDLPRSPDDYVHRIGRTGRAGAAGLAVSFTSAATHAHLRLIARRLGLGLVPERVAGFEPVETVPAAVPAPPGTGGIKGRRPSRKDKLRAASAAAAAARAAGQEPPGGRTP